MEVNRVEAVGAITQVTAGQILVENEGAEQQGVSVVHNRNVAGKAITEGKVEGHSCKGNGL